MEGKGNKVRRVVGSLGLLFAIVLVMAACGGAGGGTEGETGDEQSAATKTGESTTETAASPDTLPEEGSIPAGEYQTQVFEPAFSFRVGKGWQAMPELPDVRGMFMVKDDVAFTFTSSDKVFDPSKLPKEVPVPAPDSVDGWINWFQEHPNLETTKPVPASVGGVSGMRIDTVLSSAPRGYPEYCPAPCVPAFSASKSFGDGLFVSGYKDRNFILNVGGKTVIVSLSLPEDEFEKLLPKYQEVLDTVEWKAES